MNAQNEISMKTNKNKAKINCGDLAKTWPRPRGELAATWETAARRVPGSCVRSFDYLV